MSGQSKRGGIFMKRKSLIISMGLVLVLSLAVVVGSIDAQGTSPMSPGQICMERNNFLFLNFDTCVVCVNKGNNNHTCLCKMLEERSLLQTFFFSNFGACVSFFAKAF
jgi:hypothetical protein